MQAYMLQALLLRKDQIEYMRTHALVQAIVNKEAADEALKSYRGVALPYLAKIQTDDRSQHIKRLMSEVSRGPMQITQVMEQKKVRSKLKTKHIERSSEEQVAMTRRVNKKMGGYM